MNLKKNWPIILVFVLSIINLILPSGLPHVQLFFGMIFGFLVGRVLNAWHQRKESSFDFRREKTQELLFLCSAQFSQVIAELLTLETASGEGVLDARHKKRVGIVIEDYDAFTHALRDSSGLPEELRHLAKVFPRKV
ncbi:MAG: hypothetical protein WC763_03060 [Candidatus Paceibacterota bacterium]|jgi:hypothetical protein